MLTTIRVCARFSTTHGERVKRVQGHAAFCLQTRVRFPRCSDWFIEDRLFRGVASPSLAAHFPRLA